MLPAEKNTKENSRLSSIGALSMVRSILAT
jgi:hypothetical protein